MSTQNQTDMAPKIVNDEMNENNDSNSGAHGDDSANGMTSDKNKKLLEDEQSKKEYLRNYEDWWENYDDSTSAAEFQKRVKWSISDICSKYKYINDKYNILFLFDDNLLIGELHLSCILDSFSRHQPKKNKPILLILFSPDYS